MEEKIKKGENLQSCLLDMPGPLKTWSYRSSDYHQLICTDTQKDKELKKVLAGNKSESSGVGRGCLWSQYSLHAFANVKIKMCAKK